MSPPRLQKTKQSFPSCFPIRAQGIFVTEANFASEKQKYFCYLQKHFASTANLSLFPCKGSNVGKQCLRDNVRKDRTPVWITHAYLPNMWLNRASWSSLLVIFVVFKTSQNRSCKGTLKSRSFHSSLRSKKRRQKVRILPFRLRIAINIKSLRIPPEKKNFGRILMPWLSTMNFSLHQRTVILKFDSIPRFRTVTGKKGDLRFHILYHRS